jgi:hypothetical protein
MADYMSTSFVHLLPCINRICYPSTLSAKRKEYFLAPSICAY